MGATTDQNLIAEQTTVVHHNFFSDLVMLILLSGTERLYTPESSKIQLFEGEKVFRHKLFIFLGQF